jgi:carbon-monoxide dehydrogenase large subunit
MSSTVEAARYGSGKAVRRIEDPALVRGAGQFTDDLKRAGQTHLVFLRSPHAHAVIKGVDKSAALALPGVLAVYSGADLVAAGVKPMGNAVPFPRPDGKPGASATRSPSPWTACASSARRWRGGRRIPRSGDERAEAVMVDFDDLPSVTDTLQAIRPGAPVLCEQAPDNIASEMKHGDAAAADAAFQRAAHVVSLDIVNQRLAPASMEPRVVLAEPDSASAAHRHAVQPDAHRARRHRHGLAGTEQGAGARARRRRGRRLRHEDRPLPEDVSRARGAHAGPAGEVGAPRTRNSVPRRMAAT